MDRYALALDQGKGAHIIKAVGLVGVVMGHQDGIEAPYTGPNTLQAKVWRSVDQGRRIVLGPLPGQSAHQHRTARAMVFRLIGIANAPVSIGARHTRGRARAKDRKF